MNCLQILCSASVTIIVVAATAGTDYSAGGLAEHGGLQCCQGKWLRSGSKYATCSYSTDSLLTNGPAISDPNPHKPNLASSAGPGYASAASMGLSPNKREYDLFGHAEPDLGPEACPYGWFGYHGSCYMLSSDQKPWVNAAIQCASMKAHLACIESADENAFLRRLLTAMQVERGAWNGLNELLHPGQETYGWGLTQQACTKYDWYGGEPVNQASGDYMCGMFFQAYDYHWHLGDCNQPNRYICEMKRGKPCECQL